MSHDPNSSSRPEEVAPDDLREEELAGAGDAGRVVAAELPAGALASPGEAVAEAASDGIPPVAEPAASEARYIAAAAMCSIFTPPGRGILS